LKEIARSAGDNLSSPVLTLVDYLLQDPGHIFWRITMFGITMGLLWKPEDRSHGLTDSSFSVMDPGGTGTTGQVQAIRFSTGNQKSGQSQATAKLQLYPPL